MTQPIKPHKSGIYWIWHKGPTQQVYITNIEIFLQTVTFSLAASFTHKIARHKRQDLKTTS